VPWIIGEAYYNDATEAAALRQQANRTGQKVLYLTEWPLTSGQILRAERKCRAALRFFELSGSGFLKSYLCSAAQNPNKKVAGRSCVIRLETGENGYKWVSALTRFRILPRAILASHCWGDKPRNIGTEFGFHSAALPGLGTRTGL